MRIDILSKDPDPEETKRAGKELRKRVIATLNGIRAVPEPYTEGMLVYEFLDYARREIINLLANVQALFELEEIKELSEMARREKETKETVQ